MSLWFYSLQFPMTFVFQSPDTLLPQDGRQAGGGGGGQRKAAASAERQPSISTGWTWIPLHLIY